MEAKSLDRSPLWFGLAGVVIGGTISGIVNYVTHKGAADTKMIELSVDILRAKVMLETLPVREWAAAATVPAPLGNECTPRRFVDRLRADDAMLSCLPEEVRYARPH